MENAAIVINEREAALVVRTALECAGYQCREFTSTMSLLRAVRRDDLKVVILDMDDSDVDWATMLEWRHNWLNPAMATVLVGRDDARQAAAALSAGADDFVARPVRGAELLARVQAAVHRRRESGMDSQTLQVGGCTLSCESATLSTGRVRVPLTAREMAVLQLLFANAGHTVSRQRLAAEVWGVRAELSQRTIDQHIYQIRRKLNRCVAGAVRLSSVYGHGYRLDTVGSAGAAAANTPLSEAALMPPVPRLDAAVVGSALLS